MTALWIPDYGLNFTPYQKEKRALNPKWPIREFFKKPTWDQWDFALKSLRLRRKIIEILTPDHWAFVKQNYWDFVNQNHKDFDPKSSWYSPKSLSFYPKIIKILTPKYFDMFQNSTRNFWGFDPKCLLFGRTRNLPIPPKDFKWNI